MNNTASIDNTLILTPRFRGLPFIAFISGIAVFIFLVLGFYVHYLFYAPAAVIIFPLLYVNKTMTVYLYIITFAYTLPLYSYRGDLRLDDILFFAVASIWFMDKMLSPHETSSRKLLTRPLLIWLGINTLSIFIILIKFGVFNTVRSGYFLIRLIEYVSVYFIISDMIKSQKMKITMIRLLWVIVLFICFYGLYQYYVEGVSKVTATLSDNHAHIGVFLTLTFFILGGYLFYTRNMLEKAFLVLTLPLMLYILFLSASRMSIVSLMFGVIIFFLFSRRLTGKITGIALIVVLVYLGIGFLENLQEYDLGVAEFQNLEEDLSLLGRFYIWYESVEMIKQNPSILITGVGLSAIKAAFGSVSPLPFGASGAHNNYLHVLIETGVSGLFVFLYLLFILLRTSLKRSRESTRSDRTLYYGYFCGLAALAFSGLSQETFSVQNAFHSILGYFFLVTAIIFWEIRDSKQGHTIDIIEDTSP